ncbi:FUSC family membrane protein [Sphingobacterium sp. HJSM2_6]|uniref:FUSC family protein n=1 Tax=Sphingobacterium sp. HJSM2_6 TaxID=3366264 RepID=UPI003BE7F106
MTDYSYFCGKTIYIINLINRNIHSLSLFFKTESSQDALRNILLILIPSFLVYQLINPHVAIAFAVGTLLASLTDLPGIKKDKFHTAITSIPLFGITAISISLLHYFNLWAIIPAVGLYGFLFTFMALFGFKYNIIGNLSLIVATFTIGLRPENPWQFTLALTLGSVFFFICSIIFSYLFPYRSLKHAVSTGIQGLSHLIVLKIDCYDENKPLNNTFKELSTLHIRVSDQLEAVRSFILRDKNLLNEQNLVTKIWLTKLYQLIELYELLMAIDNDYEDIRSILKKGNSLSLIQKAMLILSLETEKLAQPKINSKSNQYAEFNNLLIQLELEGIRGNFQQRELIQSIANQLRQIAKVLQNIPIKKIQNDQSWVETKNIKDFVNSKVTYKAIKKNLTFKSPIFSYAVRMAILLMLGTSIGFFLPEFRFSSWILLTIILVARPTLLITQKRNYQRIVGSIIGIILSLILLLTIQNTYVLIIIASASLYLFLLFNKPNYLVCVVFITVTILLGQFMYEGEILDLLGSRLIFTLLGSLLAVIGCLAIPINYFRPVALHSEALINQFNSYVQHIEASYHSKNINYYELRLQRKYTQSLLAQCYDALTQLENEPSKGRTPSNDIAHFQNLAYRINALILGLSINMTKIGFNLSPDTLNEKLSFLKNLIQETDSLSKAISTYKHKKINWQSIS